MRDKNGDIIPDRWKWSVGVYLLVTSRIDKNGALTWYHGPAYYETHILEKKDWLTTAQFHTAVQRFLLEFGEIKYDAHKKNSSETICDEIVDPEIVDKYHNAFKKGIVIFVDNF